MVILTIIGSMVAIFFAALLFVNAIEWVGCRFNLEHSFVGAILAPLFTSIPELVVFLVAIFSLGGKTGQDIAIGTLYGEPFMVSSLAYGLVGIVVLIAFLNRKRAVARLNIHKHLMVPYIFIIFLFPLSLIPAIFNTSIMRYLFGFLFLSAFFYYVWLMYSKRIAEEEEESEELYACKFLFPKSGAGQITGAIVQLLFAGLVLFFASDKMVTSVSTLATNLNISALGLALLIVPAATAIPETTSALIWAYRGKDTLAMGSLVGEKILYSTVYPGLGLFLTQWNLDIHAYLSIGATTVVSLLILYFIKRELVPWYGLFLGTVFFIAYAVLVLGLHL